MSSSSVCRQRLVRGLPAVGLGILLLLTTSACGSPSGAHQGLGFGTLPAYLPKTTQPVDRVVTASAAQPQLAVQGVAVKVDLPAGQVTALITGPTVPPFVAPPPPEVTATFTVSLTHASGTVPVQPSDFTITDQLGRTFEPTLVSGEKAPPAAVPAGSTVQFQLTAVMPTGDGRIHWSPSGGQPIVSWDFVVEND